MSHPTWHFWVEGVQGWSYHSQGCHLLNQVELFLHFAEYHPPNGVLLPSLSLLLPNQICNQTTIVRLIVIENMQFLAKKDETKFCWDFSVSIGIGRSANKVGCQVRLAQLIKYEIVLKAEAKFWQRTLKCISGFANSHFMKWRRRQKYCLDRLTFCLWKKNKTLKFSGGMDVIEYIDPDLSTSNHD